jgi:pseudouridine synthase
MSGIRVALSFLKLLPFDLFFPMPTKPILTLDRVLSRFGLASRTAAREAIVAGRMKVNGRIVRDPDVWVNPGRDTLHLDGQRLKPARKRYLLFYKPKGVISSHGDPAGRETIYKYLGAAPPPDRGGRRPPAGARNAPLPEVLAGPMRRIRPNPENWWLAPVGRLDKDTSGLLLLTNDTEFADFVTNPDSEVLKTYLVKTNALLSDEVIAQLNAGVEMKRGDFARPLSVRRREDRGKYTWLEVVLTEGKNREVRRMIEAVGFKVLKLVRTSIGPLTLEGLEVGKWRELTPAEVTLLRRSANRVSK